MKKWVFPIILGLAFILRLVALDKYPVGFTPDEASFGYDAYSILRTGRDQWGNWFPLVLKSFGDYKAPLYAYISIPFVALFDLTKVSVRLPNAILGSLAVYIVYLLTIKIREMLNIRDNKLETIVSLLLAFSPWHIMMARGAFEANLITFFIPLGIYLFLKEKYKLSALVFGLNLFTYHSAKVVTPLVVLLLIWLNWNMLKKHGIKKFIVPLATIAFFGILTLYTFTQGAGARVNDINIFSGSVEAGSVEKNLAVNSGEPYLLSKLIHNKFTVSFDRFISNYFSYFSPQFLLTRGPAETTYGMIPGLGVLNIVEFIGLIAFLIFLIKYENYKVVAFLVGWILIAVIPASLATGPGYAGNRAVAMIPAVQIISALGLYQLIQYRKYIQYLLLAVGFLSFAFFLEKYIYLSPSKSAGGMLYGNLEVSNYISKNSDNYNQIIVSKLLSEPHIYIAFASKYDPSQYQKNVQAWNFEDENLKWVDQMDRYELGKFVFKRYNWRESVEEKTLVVGRPEEFLDNLKLDLTIFYPDGGTSIYVKSN